MSKLTPDEQFDGILAQLATFCGIELGDKNWANIELEVLTLVKRYGGVEGFRFANERMGIS